MTREQLEEIGAVTLRWFAPYRNSRDTPSIPGLLASAQLVPQPKNEHQGMWRAARSEHYYTSDTRRLVEIGSDIHETVEGWGKSPEEALVSLAAAIVSEAAAGARAARKAADERAEEATRLAKKLKLM